MRCTWGTCNSDRRYPDRCVGVKFIPFVRVSKLKPWNRDKCLRWIKACGRPHSQLNIDNVGRNHYICSKHFVDGQPTPENPDPISAIRTPGQTSSDRKRKLPMKRTLTVTPKIRKSEAAKVLLSLQESPSPDKTNGVQPTEQYTLQETSPLDVTEETQSSSSKDQATETLNEERTDRRPNLLIQACTEERISEAASSILSTTSSSERCRKLNSRSSANMDAALSTTCVGKKSVKIKE